MKERFGSVFGTQASELDGFYTGWQRSKVRQLMVYLLVR